MLDLQTTGDERSTQPRERCCPAERPLQGATSRADLRREDRTSAAADLGLRGPRGLPIQGLGTVLERRLFLCSRVGRGRGLMVRLSSGGSWEHHRDLGGGVRLVTVLVGFALLLSGCSTSSGGSIAGWEAAPDQELSADSQTTDLLVYERECASGQTAEDRMQPPGGCIPRRSCGCHYPGATGVRRGDLSGKPTNAVHARTRRAAWTP